MPSGWRPHIWSALRYESGAQMQRLRNFVLSEGARYQDLTLASQDLEPRSMAGSLADGLDGWSFLMRTAERDFALAYFEVRAQRARLKGFTPGQRYRWTWFDPRTGSWSKPIALAADATGALATPAFPAGAANASRDVAAKILMAR